MRDNTQSRVGVWYPRSFMTLTGYCMDIKKWKTFEMDGREPVVFVRDTMEMDGQHKGSHILIIRMHTVLHPRINNARWRKKFER